MIAVADFTADFRIDGVDAKPINRPQWRECGAAGRFSRRHYHVMYPIDVCV